MVPTSLFLFSQGQQAWHPLRSETTELKPLFTKFQDDQTGHTGGIFTTVGFRHHIFGEQAHIY